MSRINQFTAYAGGRELNRKLMREWLESLSEKRLSKATAKDCISAVNRFLRESGHDELRLIENVNWEYADGALVFLEKPKNDLTGKRFGRLTVIGEDRNVSGQKRWRCKCDCGTEVSVTSGHLNAGTTTSCGCVAKERQPDLTGMRFGSLVVSGKSGEQNAGGGTMWNCVCDCGNKCQKSTGHLTSGAVRSCGCSWHESAVKAGEKYGRLTAIRPTDERSGTRAVIWLCMCDCGKEVKAEARSLVSGHTTSCGCYMRDSNRDKLKNLLTYIDDTCLEFLEDISAPRSSTSPETGVRGVHVVNGKYEARINYRKKMYYLGRYSKLEDAINARQAAEDEVKEYLSGFYERAEPLPEVLSIK